MNKTQNKFNFKAFIMLLTALVLSLVLCCATACGGNSSESSSASESESSSENETVNDTQMIANGNFELYVPKTATYPYTLSSTVKWSSRTTYGTTKSSGIIDITKDAYKDKGLEREGVAEGESKILMLANDVNSQSEGAAQYTTSNTTITAEYGVDYKLTVWVLTKDVAGKYSDNNPEVNTGAYIEIKNTVGQAIQSTIVDNIDTKGEWKQYAVYLRPSNYATTKYPVVLGFGHGSSDNKLRGCSGYAYFDDVKMEKLENGEYDKAAGKALSLYNGENKTEEAFVLDTAKAAENAVKVDFAKEAAGTDVLGGGNGEFNKFNVNNKNDSEGYAVNAPENGELTVDFSQLKREYGSSYSYTTIPFDLEKYVDNDKDATTDYKGIMISFVANVSAKSYSKNASVKVLDNNKENGGFDSFATDGKDVRYAIYLTTNRTDGAKPLQYQLKITFGPTAESSVNADFPIGKAVFKDFKVVKLNEEEFNLADTSNNGTKVTLLGDYNSDVSDDDDKDDETKDSYTITTGAVMYDATKKDADGRYDGLEVGVEQITSGAYRAAGNESDGNKAILVNSGYNYSIAGLNDALNALKADYIAGLNGDNKEVQAIALYSANGYYIRMTSNGLPITVPANSVYSFSVKLRVIEGEAFVRLYDYDTTEIDSTSQIAKLTVNGTDYKMLTKVTANSKKALDGYTTVTFVVRTGNKAKTLELQYGFEGKGAMLIGSADKGATYSAASDYDTLVKAYAAKSSLYELEKTDSYTKTVKYYTDKDKKNPVKEEDESGNKVDKVVETTDVVVSYGYLKDASGDGKTAVVMLYRFDTIDSDNYVIESDESESNSSSESDSTSGNSAASYAWLQIISIIIAIALVAALVAVIIRMATKNKKSKKTRTEAYYQKGYDKSKRYSGNGKNANKNNIEAPEETDEAYDYGDGENGDGENKD